MLFRREREMVVPGLLGGAIGAAVAGYIVSKDGRKIPVDANGKPVQGGGTQQQTHPQSNSQQQSQPQGSTQQANAAPQAQGNQSQWNPNLEGFTPQEGDTPYPAAASDLKKRQEELNKQQAELKKQQDQWDAAHKANLERRQTQQNNQQAAESAFSLS